MSDLSKLREVAEAATEGPWSLDERAEFRGIRSPGADGRPWVAYGMTNVQREADAVHIATFDPPTVLALLYVLHRVELFAGWLQMEVGDSRSVVTAADVLQQFGAVVGDVTEVAS